MAVVLGWPQGDGTVEGRELAAASGLGSSADRVVFAPRIREHSDAPDTARTIERDAESPEVVESYSQALAALRADLDRKLDGETRDDAWSDAAEASYARLFGEDPQLVGTTLQHVECHATLCRLTLIHVDGEMQRDFGGLLGWLPGLDGHGLLVPGPGDTSFVYSARPGHRLPLDLKLLQMAPDAAGSGA